LAEFASKERYAKEFNYGFLLAKKKQNDRHGWDSKLYTGTIRKDGKLSVRKNACRFFAIYFAHKLSRFYN